MEGSEPPFFTRFFKWDSAKSAVSSHVILMTAGRFKILTIGNSFYFADAGKLIPKEANACEKWGCSRFGCKAYSPCPPLTITNY